MSTGNIEYWCADCGQKDCVCQRGTDASRPIRIRRRPPEEVAPHVALNAMKAERKRIIEIVKAVRAMDEGDKRLSVPPYAVCDEILRRIGE